MNINRQGYFKEMPHGNADDPSIKDYIGKGDASIINSVCSYLQSGVPLAVTPGVVNDIINPEKGVAGSPSSYTDGTWVWPGDLAYYVKNYRLLLSDEFVNSMKANNWAIPINEDDLDLESLTIDGKSVFD